MRWERWDGNLLPDFTVGQEFVPSTLQLRESTTHAPPLLSESDLIAIMDDNGIGTDATIAEHIATVQTRQYVIPCAFESFRSSCTLRFDRLNLCPFTDTFNACWTTGLHPQTLA